MNETATARVLVESSRTALLRGVFVLTVTACSGPPHVRAPLPDRAPHVRASLPEPPEAARCTDCCDDSVFAIELAPESTLDFRPSRCELHLAGWYALRMALSDRRQVDISLSCREVRDGERFLTIRYHGAPVGEASLTDLADPLHTGGREGVTLVNHAVEGPLGLVHHRFERGEIRFDRPPRGRLEAEPSPHGKYVEIGLDLHFEGNRRFRAALRLCPTYAPTGPVSDPVE